jgi:transposase
VTLVHDTLDEILIQSIPERLIGDKAYDSYKLDAELAEKGIEMIAPNRANRRKTQDGRQLRRYKRRWKVERLFAWIQNYRRCLNRFEYRLANYEGFLKLVCIIILTRHF